jgi:hypothetical protein
VCWIIRAGCDFLFGVENIQSDPNAASLHADCDGVANANCHADCNVTTDKVSSANYSADRNVTDSDEISNANYSADCNATVFRLLNAIPWRWQYLEFTQRQHDYALHSRR